MKKVEERERELGAKRSTTSIQEERQERTKGLED
ncbi:uncharacterized protein G2W53_039421 [Senna tora]|uniref:Uncharacterized protein n=1 Tax=Senna tora TaxID=362788 RepID=A0A834W2U4_9FABA|nr:uncharacterized protein G2W53_039421 [Senna tora]